MYLQKTGMSVDDDTKNFITSGYIETIKDLIKKLVEY